MDLKVKENQLDECHSKNENTYSAMLKGQERASELPKICNDRLEVSKVLKLSLRRPENSGWKRRFSYC